MTQTISIHYSSPITVAVFAIASASSERKATDSEEEYAQWEGRAGEIIHLLMASAFGDEAMEIREMVDHLKSQTPEPPK